MAAAESTPRVAALAEQQVVLLTVHSSSLAMLFAAVFYVRACRSLAARTPS